MAAGTVRVKGLRELQRDFRKISKDLSKEVRVELKRAAEPVATKAEDLALDTGNISRSPRWAAMRIGVSQKRVYVAPRGRRRAGSPRPNFAPLLLERAMIPALHDRRDEVVQGLERALDRLAGRNGF